MFTCGIFLGLFWRLNFHIWINLKNEPNKLHNHYLVSFGMFCEKISNNFKPDFIVNYKCKIRFKAEYFKICFNSSENLQDFKLL